MDKELIDSLITIVNGLNSVGFFKFMILLTFVLYAVPIGKTIYRIFDFVLSFQVRQANVKQKQVELVSLELEKEEKFKMFEGFKMALEQVKEHNKLVDDIFKALQISPSNQKYEVLLESFLGIDRSFNNDIKSKLLYFLESGRKDRFVYTRKDIINSMREKVFSKLSMFVFNDKEYFDSIAGIAKERLDKFLDEFENVDDPEEAKLILDDDEKGTIPLLEDIQKEIVIEYYKRFSADPNTDYLKRRDG